MMRALGTASGPWREWRKGWRKEGREGWMEGGEGVRACASHAGRTVMRPLVMIVAEMSSIHDRHPSHSAAAAAAKAGAALAPPVAVAAAAAAQVAAAAMVMAPWERCCATT